MINNSNSKNDKFEYSFDELVDYKTKRKVNPFDIPTEYVQSPIPIFSTKEKENWARLPKEAVPGLTDDILVSDHGKVFNATKNMMIAEYDSDGYKRCKLPTENGQVSRGVHKLILLSFDRIPEPADTKLIPNHVDAKKDHNELDNLEWATYRYNTEHAVMNNLNSKLTVSDVEEICEMLESKKYTTKEIAENFDCNDSNIRNIKSGVDWNYVSKKYNIESMPRFEDKKIEKICELLETNQYTDTQIAEICGVSRTHVHDIRTGRRRGNISNNYNLDKSDKRNPVCDETVKKICEMLAENKYTESYIARECNVSRPYVHNVATGKTRTDISSKYFSDYKVSESKKTVTPEQITKVKELLKTNKYTDNAISKMVGVSRWTVDRLKNTH